MAKKQKEPSIDVEVECVGGGREAVRHLIQYLRDRRRERASTDRTGDEVEVRKVGHRKGEAL